MHGIVYPGLYVFIIIYTSVDIKYSRAKQVEVTTLRAEENTCAAVSSRLVSHCKLHQALEIQINCSKNEVRGVFIGKPATWT